LLLCFFFFLVPSFSSFSPYFSLSLSLSFFSSQVAERLGAAIFVHPWDMEQGGRYKDYWLPWLVGMPAETATAIVAVLMGGVLERFPRLKLCFAHGGGSVTHGVAMCAVLPENFSCFPSLSS
jgi:aminocarboxymuconate-semialdehyde decarboxylase